MKLQRVGLIIIFFIIFSFRSGHATTRAIGLQLDINNLALITFELQKANYTQTIGLTILHNKYTTYSNIAVGLSYFPLENLTSGPFFSGLANLAAESDNGTYFKFYTAFGYRFFVFKQYLLDIFVGLFYNPGKYYDYFGPGVGLRCAALF